MMRVTADHTVYPGYALELAVKEGDRLDDDPWPEGQYRLALLQSGRLGLRAGESERWAEAPALLCLHPAERPVLALGDGAGLRSAFFAPAVVNSAFTLANVPAGAPDFRPTDYQDLYLLAPFADRQAFPSPLVPLWPGAGPRFASLLDLLARELGAQRDGYWGCRSRSYLLEALFLLQRVGLRAGDPGLPAWEAGEDALVDEVAAYLHANYRAKQRLEALCARFGTNRTSLARRFRARSGHAPMEYLALIRLAAAGLLLRDCTIPLAEVPGRVGYADYSRFSRDFRARYGAPPREYREEHNRLLAHNR